jgi:creatinine amidohydrolase
MQYGERKWTEIGDLTSKIVVLPLGSLEQHGHHLPILTDSMIGGEIIRRAEADLGDEALFLPMLWVGASDHHRAFAGTVSLSNDVYVKVLIDILESLIANGFRRILMVNAHGGNILPGNMAMYDVQLRHKDKADLWIVMSTWFVTAGKAIAAIDELEQKHVTHACELETSMILRLRPELVKLEAARGANIPFESAFYCPDSSRSSRVDVRFTFDHITETGALGHPEKATAEKGEALYQAATGEIVALVREFASWPLVRPQ